MPYKSERQRLLLDIELLIILLDTDGEEEEAEDLYHLYQHISNSRYTAERTVTKRPPHYFTDRFPVLSAIEFRSMFRTTREGFSALLALIQDHPVFSNNSTCPQAHPYVQLGVALARFGVNGTGASVGKMQGLFGIGTGTATVYTNRVLQALWDKRTDWIMWPNPKRRKEIGQVMKKEGFPSCIGFIDGTTIPLSQKPALDGEVYFDRKKRYSVAMQVVCDVDKRIIAIHAGCPGSCADSTVFKLMPHYKQPHLFFSRGEYLLADSAYGLSSTCIPTYKIPAANKKENKEFNYCVAKSRVRNEHCIGILKSRWSSLQEMRQQIRSDTDMQILLRWVVACCVLHNMLARLGDAWEEMYLESEDDENDGGYIDGQLDPSTSSLREMLKITTLETNYRSGVLPLQ